MSFWKRLIKDKRGNALILAGAALPLVIGSAGLASDTIQWALWKRQLQRAADSAALAGTYAKVQNNALQTPKLPDWAIVDLRTAPGPHWPGKIVDAGFFDESWK